MAEGKGIKAGDAFIKLGLSTAGMARSLRNVVGRIGRVTKAAVAAGAALAAAFGGAAIVAVGKAVTTFTRLGDQFDKMSKRTGASTEALSELTFAAEQSGASGKDIDASFRGMARSILNLERGLSTSKDSFDDLGLTMADLLDKSPEERFSLIVDRLSKIEDPTKRAALAMSVLGKSANTLLPLINGGADGLSNLREQAQILGRSVSAIDAANAAKLADTWNELKSILTGLAVQIGGKLAPELIRIATMIRNLALDWNLSMKQMKLGVNELIEGVLELNKKPMQKFLDTMAKLSGKSGLLKFTGASDIERITGALTAANQKLRQEINALKADSPITQLEDLLNVGAGEAGDSASPASAGSALTKALGSATSGGFGATREQLGGKSLGRRQLAVAEMMLAEQKKLREAVENGRLVFR